MTAAHSPEPWRQSPARGMEDVVYGPDSQQVCNCCAGAGRASPANARRVVACVNACAGIPTEALEAGELADLLRNAKVAAELSQDVGFDGLAALLAGATRLQAGV